MSRRRGRGPSSVTGATRTASKTVAKKTTTTAKKWEPPPPNPNKRVVRRMFSKAALKRVCEAYELDFPTMYPDLQVEIVEKRKTNNFYYFADRGSDILFVAHLDTVVHHEDRMCDFADTPLGTVVHSGTLDDRLGAYIGLELLPKLGLCFDILLTVGEESHQSTAEFFEPPEGKVYKWVIEFDRKGTDVVMYQYDDHATDKLVRANGTKTAHGSFSDIAELEHLEVKCFNWGCGYDGVYHSVKGFAYLEDTFEMVGQFMDFHEANKDTHLAHEKRRYGGSSLYGGYDYGGGGYGHYGGAGVGGSHSWEGNVRRWDPDLKVWVATDPKSTKVWSEGRQYDSYEAYYKQKYPTDEGTWVCGERFESYDDYWAKKHPDEPMILDDGPTLWGHG